MAYILNAEGNFFLQEERSEPFDWKTCTGVGDIAVPSGDSTPIYCQDPLNSGQFVIEGYVKGDPAAGTYTLVKPLTTVYNALLEVSCGFVGRVNWVCRGNREDPQNYEVAVIMYNSDFTSKGITNPVREPEGTSGRVNTNGAVNFTQLLMVYPLTIAQQALSNTADAHAIYFLPKRCEDRCGPARGLCEHGIMGLEGPLYPSYLYDSEVKNTIDGGSIWAAVAADPYTYGGATGAVYIFETLTGEKYVVFRSLPVIGAPAECAYSTDRGASWTNVAIGNLNAQAINCVSIVGAKMVVGATGGYIYVSSNQAATWSAEESGVETTEDINAIDFFSDTVGYAACDNNVLLYTLTGPEGDWASRTGPVAGRDLLSLAVNDQGHVFVGTNDGRIFRSEDQGETWVETVDLGGGRIEWIDFDPKADYVGGFIHNDSAPEGALYRSEDGGATWFEVPDMPTNAGLNAGFICDENNIFVVGNVYNGTTFVARTLPGTAT